MWYTMSAGCVTERMQREAFRKFVKWCAEQAREKGREPDFVAFRDGTEYVVVLTGRDGDKRELFAEFERRERMYSIVHSMETYRIPKEQFAEEKKRLHGLEKKYGRVVAYAAVRDGDYFQMFVENVPLPKKNSVESNSEEGSE